MSWRERLLATVILTLFLTFVLFVFFLGGAFIGIAHALPLQHDLLMLAYCDLNPASIYACLDRDVPFLVDVQVRLAPLEVGALDYEIPRADAVALGIPPITSMDFYGLITGQWYTVDPPDYFHSQPVAFIALAPVVPLLAGDGGDGPVPTHTPEPGTLLLLGTLLAGVGWRVRRGR